MRLDDQTGLFGNQTRTRVLLLLSVIEESHPTELSRLMGSSLSNVQKAVEALERAGVLSVRSVGRTRVATLNPRYFARDELEALLRKIALSDEQVMAMASEVRKRPRKTGKQL